MQPDSPLPPDAERPTEPSVLDDLVALTGLFNPEQIWREEEILDKLDEQAREEASRDLPPPDHS